MIDTKPIRRRILLAVVVVTAFLIFTAMLTLWHYSFSRRFARSKYALDAFAAQVMASDRAAPITLPNRLGDFQVDDPLRLPHGFLFRTDYGNPFDWNGLAYSTEPLPNELPDPQPSNDPQQPTLQMSFEHIEGNWYKVYRQ